MEKILKSRPGRMTGRNIDEFCHAMASDGKRRQVQFPTGLGTCASVKPQARSLPLRLQQVDSNIFVRSETDSTQLEFGRSQKIGAVNVGVS